MKKEKKVSTKVKAKSFIHGFKEFVMRGNVIDMAVGVIIGGAFGKIITSLVNDIILPPLGVLLNGVDFKDLKVLIYAPGDVYISYGNFIQVVLEFLIIAFSIYAVLFFIIKRRQIEAELLRKQEEKAKELQEKADEKAVNDAVVAAAAKEQGNEVLVILKEIRDLLGEKKK